MKRAKPPYPAGETFFCDNRIFRLPELGVFGVLYDNYEIPRHAHEFTELNLVVGGRGHHFILDQAFPVKAGDVFVIPPNVQHAYSREGDLRVWHLLFNNRFIDRNAAKLFLLPGFLMLFTVEPYFRAETNFRYGLRLNPGRRAELNTLFTSITQHLSEHERIGSMGIEALALYLIALLCRYYVEQHGCETNGAATHPQTAAIHSVLAHVEKHFGEKLTLQRLAKVAHMEPSYFGRLFRAATHLTPLEYVNRVRIQAAQRLLIASEKSLTTIAQETGFYDSAHFSRMFTRVAGQSPLRFRKGAGGRMSVE
jgi:AraC-like DNA-binding protein